MSIRAVSHVAIGVRDMDRALAFYRDALGLRVRADQIEDFPSIAGAPPRQRRGVYLCYSEGPDESFLVLDQQLSMEPFGEPAQLFSVAIHHMSFWVDDIDAIAEGVKAAGFEVLLMPANGDSKDWGEPPGKTIRSSFLRDPDGNFIQLDQRC
jgi:catechol 2,3-dioxygenase-like lactoylglutathione lyase family enzyme